MKYIFFIILFLLFNQCNAQKVRNNSQIPKLTELFIKEEKIPETEIILIRFSNVPNESNYLVVLYSFYPNMYLGFNDFDNDLGLYRFKNFEVSFMAEKGIDVKNMVFQGFNFFSKKGFRNTKGEISNYDPIAWKFYVDKNFNYLKSFYNTKDEIKKSEEIKRFLEMLTLA